MSYLLDKKLKQKKILKIGGVVLILLFLFHFRSAIFSGFSTVAHVIFRPVLVFGGSVRDEISYIRLNFQSKKTLLTENGSLEAQIAESAADRANYTSVVDDNTKMKEILGRKPTKTDFILAGILAKPNQSPYDTLVIDAGGNEGVANSARVFALGNVPIGRVAEVLPNSSKVILFSNPGEKTDVVVGTKGAFMQAVGRGGGNFEIILPKDFSLAVGTEVDLPGINSYILGTVETIISDPRDAFQKALLASPVNIQELKFVEIEK